MFDNEKFLMRISHLMLCGMKLTARVEAMGCGEFTTRMKALKIAEAI